MFQAVQSRFVGLMEALKDKLPAEEPAAELEPAAAEQAAPAEAETQVEEPSAEAETQVEEPPAETAEASSDETSTEGEE
jgi:hypothetical protein